MSKINKIRLSGTDYDIQDVSATSVVELTQQQYDDLPASAKTDNILYIITDSTVDYVTSAQTQSAITQAVSGKVDTATYAAYTAATDTAIAGKQATLVSGTNIKTINNESILGEGNIDIQGGGKAINAGRGIRITTGETADTVSFNLPISAGTGTDSIIGGKGCKTEGNYSFVFGLNNTCNRNTIGNYIFGESNTSNYGCSYTSIGGYSNTATTSNGGHIEGFFNQITNSMECAYGWYNVSNKASSTFGDSGNTLFSVGNGTSKSARHNAFEIRQNGDIYLTKDGQDVKLQDQLGGGGSSYTAGDGIDITNNVISVTGKVDTSTYETYTAATDTALNGKQDTLVSSQNIKTINNESLLGSGNIDIQGGNSVVELTQAAYDALVTGGTVDPDTFYIITDAEAGDLTNYYTKSETNTLLNAKQATLVSGTNIKTINNESILGSGNITIQGGGGKAVTGGTNISVTTGETADTINCTLPIAVGNGSNSIGIGTNTLNNANRVLAVGDGNKIYNQSANSFVGGMRSEIKSNCPRSIAFGYQAIASAGTSFSFGSDTVSKNSNELSTGRYNASNTGSTDADNTLFSVGNGTDENARHNAFEIRKNGDIYITLDGQDVKLQDNLGGGGASYSAGTGIDITNNVISVSGVVETSAITTSVTSSSTDVQVPSAKAVNNKLGGLSLVRLTKAEYDALSPNYDSNTLYVING